MSAREPLGAGRGVSGPALLTPGCLSRSLPMHKMTNTDIGRIMRSQEIQKALRPPK